mgnify:CR=1 FL=1
MKEQIFLGVIGFSGGLVIAGGIIALMVGLGVITRFIGISHTAKHVRIFEDAILLGSVFGTLMTVYQPTIPLDAAGLAVLGLFSGIFVGGWILALAEIVNLFLCLVKSPAVDPVYNEQVEHRKSSRVIRKVLLRDLDRFRLDHPVIQTDSVEPV